MAAAYCAASMKGLEQAAYDKGSWKTGWLLTGLPDPRPGRRPAQGLAHPAEFAASVSRVREIASLETAMHAAAGAEWKSQPTWNNKEWWKKDDKGGKGGKDKKGKDKDGKGKNQDGGAAEDH